MFRPPQVLEVLERVLDHSFVERPEIRARMSKRIAPQEVPEIPVDELPIEAVVVAHEERPATGFLRDPSVEVLHDLRRIGKGKALVSGESADRERFRYPFLRDRFQPRVEASLEARLDHDCPEAGHAVVTRYRAVRFHIHHDVGHCPGFQPSQSQTASPMMSALSACGIQSISWKCVTHCRQEHGILVMSVPQNSRCGPNASYMAR